MFYQRTREALAQEHQPELKGLKCMNLIHDEQGGNVRVPGDLLEPDLRCMHSVFAEVQ